MFDPIRRWLGLETKAALNAPSLPPALSKEAVRDLLWASMSPVGSAPTTDRDRIKAAEQHPVVMACIRRIAWASASVKFSVADQYGDVNADHPLAFRINNPNTLGASHTFQLLYTSLAITGHAFLYKINSEVRRQEGPAGLFCLRPDRVVKQEEADGTVTGYDYHDGRTVQKLSPEDVIEITHPWLSDKPLPAMTPGWGPISLYQAASGLSRKVMQNSGGLPGLLVFTHKSDQPLTNEQGQNMRDYFTTFRAGGDKFGEIGMLDTAGHDAKFIRLTEDLEKLAPVNLKSDAMREICAIYGVPPLLLGMGADATYANQAEARRYFWLDTIIPGYVEPLASALSGWFGVQVKPDLSEVAALQDWRMNQISTMGASEIFSMNEKREAAGYDPIIGGDVMLQFPGKVRYEDLTGQAVPAITLEDYNQLQAAQGTGAPGKAAMILDATRKIKAARAKKAALALAASGKG